MVGFKKCSKCNKLTSLLDFHMTKRKYGKKTYVYTHAKCRNCRNAEKREWNARNVAKIAFRNAQAYHNKTLKRMVRNEGVLRSNKQIPTQGGMVGGVS